MKDLFNNMPAMMASLATCMDEMEGGGRNKRKVSFRGDPPARRTQAPAPKMASQPHATPAATTSLPPPPPQPHGSQERLAHASSVSQLPSLPVANYVRLEVPYQNVA